MTGRAGRSATGRAMGVGRIIRAVKNIFVAMPKKSLNTGIDQIFSDMPTGDQTALARSEKSFGWRPIAAVAVLLAAVILGLWYYLWRPASLADHLPADSEFYISLELPANDAWYQSFKFWSSAPSADASAARLYQKLGFSDSVLPLLSGRLELARLAGGGLVFQTRLADKAGWLRFAQIDSNNYRDQVLQTLPAAPASWWTALAAPDSKIYWLIDGDDLFLSDRADLPAGIKNKPITPLSSQLENNLIKPDFLTIFVSNLTFLPKLAPAYAAPLQETLSGPLIIKARLDGQKLVWSTPGAQVNVPAETNTQPNYDLAIFARDFSQAYSGWKNILTQPSLGFKPQAGLLPANIEQLEQIAKEFYQLDIQSFAQKLGQRNITFYLNGSDWLLAATGGEETSDTGITAGLEALGASLFALTHPQAVERMLSDGSTMVELRAETAGLDWQTYVWSGGGQEYNLKSLSGQGEPGGFYAGYVPGLGYILTNQMEFFNKIALNPPAPTCFKGNEVDLGVVITPGLLTSDPLIIDIIKNIAVSASASGRLAGCLAF